MAREGAAVVITGRAQRVDQAMESIRKEIRDAITKTMQVALARGLAETTLGTAVTVIQCFPAPLVRKV